MTLAEKVGQLVQVQARGGGLADLDARIRAGRVGSIFGTVDVAVIERYRRVARDETRLGIPLLVGNDVIHGYRTVFPIPLAEACTWDLGLIERTARVAAQEARANGTDWIFAPMVDICRDARWGRIAEGAGEDPHLGGAIAAARVRGFQSVDGIAACPKHYVAYGAAEAGRDYNSVEISERTLRDVYLPPFKAAFDAGALTVMSAFNDIAGVPATANTFTLTTILRDEWHWQGAVVSDYTAINELIQHGIAANLKESARLSILAGIDVDMMSDAYDQHLANLVETGEVPLAVVEDAVRRMLALKWRLGLFASSSLDVATAERALLTQDARALALQAAQESIVLLKNDGGLLPLDRAANVSVVGPLADSGKDMLGCWSHIGRSEDVETILEGLANTLDRRPRYVSDDPSAAVAVARDSDVTIAVLGETADLSGEAHSRAHLGLPGAQQSLVDAVAKTGTALVVVLVTGRPLAIPRVVEAARAMLVAWHPGIRAGQAIANILFGEASPSGRLVVSFPRAEGQLPVYYGHKNTGRPPEGEGALQFDVPFRSTYLDERNAPLFPFGFGLTYTEFTYTDLSIEQPVGDSAAASVTITNTGTRTGTEVVQLYVRDVVASVTRPVRELKAFQRVSLQPGEARRVYFNVSLHTLGFTGLDLRYRVESGEFKVWIGPDSSRGLEGVLRVE